MGLRALESPPSRERTLCGRAIGQISSSSFVVVVGANM
jgi:hypothetical protein